MVRRVGHALASGQIWTYDFRSADESRPVVIISRAHAMRFLHAIVVAPVTKTVRGVPSQVIPRLPEKRCDASS